MNKYQNINVFDIPFEIFSLFSRGNQTVHARALLLTTDLCSQDIENEIRTCGLPYAFSSQRLDKIKIVIVHAKKFITIENLTSYEDFHENGTVKFYTGGFISFPARELLSKIYKDNPEVKYMHWSDIDCGGIRIFKHIRNYVPAVIPYRMDIGTLEKGKNYWTSITDNDRDYLETCIDDTFSEVIGYMLKYGIKLEQESIYA